MSFVFSGFTDQGRCMVPLSLRSVVVKMSQADESFQDFVEKRNEEWEPVTRPDVLKKALTMSLEDREAKAKSRPPNKIQQLRDQYLASAKTPACVEAAREYQASQDAQKSV